MHLTVNEFLSAIFGGELPAGESVCLAEQVFYSDKWVFPARRPLAGDYPPAGRFFCVSTIADTGGKLVRTKANCRGLYCLVMDDIGTKCAEPPLPPSWILESSPGNFQWGYILTQPLEEGEWDRALDVWRGFAVAGYTDAAVPDVNRLMRVPGSMNLKPAHDGFEAVMHVWEPTRTFTPEQMAEGAGVTPVSKADTRRVVVGTDPLLPYLGITDVGAGWQEITCPWAAGHTTGADTAGYHPIRPNNLARAFNCLHEHCRDRDTADFLAHVAQHGGGIYTTTSGPLAAEGHAALMTLAPNLDVEQLPDLQRTQNGHPKAKQPATGLNVEWACDRLGIEVLMDVQRRKLVLRAAWCDDQPRVLAVLLNKLAQIGMESRAMVREILADLCVEYCSSEDSIPTWDGVDRMPAMLASVQVEPGYEKVWDIFLRRWLIQAVQSWTGWRNPQGSGGVLVFVGAQGVGKTRWFESLHPGALCGHTLVLGMGGKDSVVSALQHPIVELGELDATFRKADVSALKAFLTAPKDDQRRPYAVESIEWPRVTVFGGSVNDHDFLQDNTGNRRYWPVAVVSCEPDHGVDMPQMWSQAREWLRAGEQWWFTNEEAAAHKIVGDAHTAASSEEELFYAFFDNRMDLPADEWTLATATEVGTMLGKGLLHGSQLRALGILLALKFGKRTKVRGSRVWCIPVSEGERNAAYGGVKVYRAR